MKRLVVYCALAASGCLAVGTYGSGYGYGQQAGYGQQQPAYGAQPQAGPQPLYGQNGYATQPQTSGPKLWVGVMEFENRAPSQPAAEWQVGSGMADQLVTALVQAGRFNVLERERVSQIMKEQDFAQTDRTAEGEFAQTGQLLRCQYLIRGVVTDFQYNSGSQGAQSHNPWGVNFKQQASFGFVAVDLRMIDTSTGQVVSAVKAEGRAQGQHVNFSFGQIGWGWNTSNFSKTPIGQAVRACIDNAVQQVVGKLGDQPYFTVVLAVEEGKAYIAGGSEVGMTPGIAFALKSYKGDLVNPVTGEKIKRYESSGMLQVESVESQYSVCTSLDKAVAKRGDRVELMK
jgi:curli biogenesis system outer membrane secretion channel CsgG